MLSDIKSTLEITGHARGGQGMVTAFEILAKIFSQAGYEVQAFPSFGVERTGAPIQAFCRISKTAILNRSNVYHPHLIVVFDESLLEVSSIFNGLRANGEILINTEKSTESFKDKAPTIHTLTATSISLSKGLGSKALPIVNAAMIGAIVKILNGDIEVAKKIIKKAVPSKPEQNAESAEIAYNSINTITNPNFTVIETGMAKEVMDVTSTPFWNKPMTLNKTGNWRVTTPKYIERTPPCSSNCPAGTDVRLFVKYTAEKNFQKAYETLYLHNPFPSACGRVCPHFCQQNCNRLSLDGDVNIGAIERFLGDYGVKIKPEKSKIQFKEKIAVIGSGPAGLTAALRLRQLGYETTVYEALSKAGGMMRVGIPEFRLPENILDKEIKKIEEEGVKIVLNKRVSVKELENDYAAILTAVGSHVGSSMNIANEELVLEGITFLRNIKINSKFKIQNSKSPVTNHQSLITKGDVVAVIGGGNTAIDVARTVLRLGGKPTIYYRRTQKEMPAIAHEVEEAIAEGVKIEFLTAPVGIKNEKVKNKNSLHLTITKMKLGDADSSGRKKPIPVKGSEKTIIVDKVIKAIGQSYNDFVFGKKLKTQQGKIDFHTKVPVFCCGDMAWGGTVTEAIGSGNEAAREVHDFFRTKNFTKKEKAKDVVKPEELNLQYYLPVAKNVNPFKKIPKLYDNFSEVVQGLTEKKIVTEAQRCLHCGDCYSCGNCFNYCPDAAISIDEDNRLRIDYEYCKGCGICFEECPCSAIEYN